MVKLKKINSNNLVDIITYFLIMVVGIVVLSFYFSGINNHLYFVSIIYCVLSVLYFVSYFLFRKTHSYEKLFLSLANVLIAAFLFFCNDSKSAVLFNSSLVMFISFILVIKGFSILRLRRSDKEEWEVKTIVTLLIGLLGAVSGYTLVNQVYYEMMLIFGYFLVSFSIINLFEPIIFIMLDEKKPKK